MEIQWTKNAESAIRNKEHLLGIDTEDKATIMQQ